MKKTLFVLLALTACSTPVTMLEHPKTREIVRCGGGMSGSMAGGMIGYNMQKKNDEDCVKQYQSRGFKLQSVSE